MEVNDRASGWGELVNAARTWPPVYPEAPLDLCQDGQKLRVLMNQDLEAELSAGNTPEISPPRLRRR